MFSVPELTALFLAVVNRKDMIVERNWLLKEFESNGNALAVFDKESHQPPFLPDKRVVPSGNS